MDSSVRHEHGGGDGEMGGMDGMDDCSMSGMMMTFHFGHCETVLFDGWKITNVGSLVGSMIGIICLAALYECLKYLREYLLMQKIHNARKSNADTKQTITGEIFSPMHGLQTLLHMIQMIISYFLMLIFMTYNGWLCIAVILGATIGYFLIGWRKATVVDITDHCH